MAKAKSQSSSRSVLFGKAEIILGTKPGFVQLAFPERPTEEERQLLKGSGFRFNPTTLQWWGHRDRAQQWGIALPTDSRKAVAGKRASADQPKRRGSPKAEAEVAASGHGVTERLDLMLKALGGLNAKLDSVISRVDALEGQGEDE